MIQPAPCFYTQVSYGAKEPGEVTESSNVDHSAGANRLTPASTEASMSLFWLAFPGSRCTVKKHKTVCTPLSIFTSSSLLSQLVWIHVTPASFGRSAVGF